MKRTKERTRVGTWSAVTIGITVLLATSATRAEEPLSAPPSPPATGLAVTPLEAISTIKQRADAQTGKNWIEPADAVLIQRKEVDWSRYLRTALRLPDWIDLGLEQRTRFESYDHPWRITQQFGGGRTDAQIPLRSRVRFGLGGNGPLRFLFEGQDSRSFSDQDPGSFRNNTTVNEFDVLQLLGSMTFNNVLGTGLRTDFHFGRMTMDFGRRRLVARNDFRNTTNAFDGLHWQIGQDKIWRFRAFVVQPVIRELVRLDEQNSKLLFWGTYFESRHVPWFLVDAYYFGLNDKLEADAANRRTYSTFGGRLFKEPKPGELDYEIETSWQTGTRGITDHFAHFQHLDIGYTINLPWTPRLLFHYDYASGDRQPGDSQDGTFDTLFGARRWEYMPTGIYGPFFRSNLHSPGWRVIVTPAQGWILQLKHRVWYLAEGRDAFVGSGLQDPTGQAGTSLGHDVELRAQWALNANLDFDAGYVHWFKGSYFDRLPASAGLPLGGNEDTDYFYFQMRVRV